MPALPLSIYSGILNHKGSISASCIRNREQNPKKYHIRFKTLAVTHSVLIVVMSVVTAAREIQAL